MMKLRNSSIMANMQVCIFLKVSKLFLFGMLKPAVGMLAIMCIGLLSANAIAEESNNTQNINAYCEQLTQEQRNTMEAVYDGDCTNGFYKLMYGVEKLDLKLKKDRDYDLTPLCEFDHPFLFLKISGLNSEFPKCIRNIKKIRTVSIYGGKYFDLAAVSDIESLKVLAVRKVETVNGILNSPQLGSLTLEGVGLSSTVNFAPQQTLDSLTLSNVNLKNLDAFQGFSNLRSIAISNMEELTDMNALTSFHQLEYLFIANIYHPYNFPMLNNHTKLEMIKIKWGYFEHVDKLQYLTGLKELRINRTEPKVTDISPLATVTSLEKLYLFEQDIDDIVPLAKLPNLKVVYLDGGNEKIKDLTEYFDIAQRKSPFAYSEGQLLSCSASTFDEYQKGKRCNEQQRQKCGNEAPGLSRKFCVWWNRD